MNIETKKTDYTQTKMPQKKKGIALITVLAFLSIFAIILVSFVFSIRIEEVTTQNYSDSVNIQQASEAAIQAVLSQVARDLDPSKPNVVLGRPQPRYISLLDPWAVGYAGQIGNDVIYDARSHQIDVRPERVFRRSGIQVYPTPIPLGVDEDPRGDATGFQRIVLNSQRGRGDGAPGLGNVDDDKDGLIDHGGDNSLASDDDEDFLLDEDPLDPRRPDSGGSGFFFPAGSGYDADGDRLGVTDESAKININFAGNNNSANNTFTYNLGLGPSELDLPVFLFGRVFQYLNSNGGISTFNSQQAEQLALQIVNFRYGSTLDGGSSPAKPGTEQVDDNGNNNPQIVEVEEFSSVFRTSTFDGEPFAVIGNQIDDDNDGFLNEEDEFYIGPTTENQSGSPITDGIIRTQNAEDFRMGDKIDNDGDGFIDEFNEGIDDPEEFNIFKPAGNDRPFTTVDDLKLLDDVPDTEPDFRTDAPPSLFEILRSSTTIYGQADQISGVLSSKNNEISKLNPNLLSNWLPVDVWDTGNADNRVDFQYSPRPKLEDILPAVQVDSDGDWQLMAEPDVMNGEGDGEDNDGDGLIDEPSDDWAGNMYPSADFDTFSEADTASMALQNGIDDDGDGQVQDENRPGEEIVRRKRVLGTQATNDGNENRPRDEQDVEIRGGMVAEGDGADNDGDNLVDDDGDFNGDGLISYDPEWHLNEDGHGDTNADGYPGLGGDPDAEDNTPEGDIVKRPDINDELLITSFADDDYDGFADFYDPQVLAAMYAPELDGVDNDNDGVVDEIGERYIAAYDDDEDGRMDEDPPEFQLALNLIDFIDSWAPYKAAQDEDVRAILSANDQDPVIADPVTIRTFPLHSTRSRAFRFHPRLLAGPNANSRVQQEFIQQMKFLLPNPPEIGLNVRYEGVEAIRINEVMPKPVIRLEAEEALESIDFDPATGITRITASDNFEINSGDADNGSRTDINIFDSNWGPAAAPQQGSQEQNTIPAFDHRPDGFRHTMNVAMPFTNMDALSSSFIFGVTNVATPPQTSTTPNIGKDPEIATWTFNNLPSGLYDAVIYIHPLHEYRPEVRYIINGQEISMRSDNAFGIQGQFIGAAAPGTPGAEQIRRDTAKFPGGQNLALPYRLTAFPLPDQTDVTDTDQRVEVGINGTLTVQIIAEQPPEGTDFYATSFDRIELFNPRVQYVELVNISTDDIELSGWQVNTPYGHYILPDNTVIGKMRPLYKEDDGRDIQENQGIEGDGVPFENLLTIDKIRNDSITSDDRLLEDNKLLLAYDKDSLVDFIRENYPDVSNIQNRIVEPVMGSSEQAQIEESINAGPTAPFLGDAQRSDVKFRLVDFQNDVLSHNPQDKHVTLYDPAGNYMDSFRYRTTFNNVIVANPSSNSGFDIVALPGYRGFETYERADPTHFENIMGSDEAGNHTVSRSVPSSIKLDVQDARVVNIVFDNDGVPSLAAVGSYTNNANDPNNTGVTRFRDGVSEPAADSHWNGWDFLGDWYEYPSDRSSIISTLLENSNSIAREAVAPAEVDERIRFFSMLGGFENRTDHRASDIPSNPDRAQVDAAELASRTQAPVTAFVWRMGVRQLIRAGYDPEVDDILTIRALGRQLNIGGVTIDIPVGEMLINPIVNIINPGDGSDSTTENPAHNFKINGDDIPVFAKLRHGDTVGSIDLRNDFTTYTRDLRNANQPEPIVEIIVMTRKSTPDISLQYQGEGGAPEGSFAVFDRPDLLPLFTDANISITADPRGVIALPASAPALYLDDNYFFKGIELFGRGRADDSGSDEANSKSVFLAGTPGRDNTGYVPAYPRRRSQLGSTQRDEFDIIDNTAYVKNGPLATIGEISRLFTGNKFETINTPIIAQWLEDRTTDPNRSESNFRLGRRASGNDPEFRIRLAQRERLDQWENQYTNIYNSITTADSVITAGLVNINTAPRELLAALPSAPLTGPGQIDTLQNRYNFNVIVADYILEGRQPGGRDGFFGVHEIDDDEAYSTFNRRQSNADTPADFKFPGVGRISRAFKNFDEIRQLVLDPLNIRPQDILENQIDFGNVFASTIVSAPDDGPYSDIGTLLSQITHLKRRERFSVALSRQIDRTGDIQPEGIGDLRERLNEQLNLELTPEDIEAIMNRVSNLMTVRSRAFGIVSRGRILDRDGAFVAQRKLETVYNR